MFWIINFSCIIFSWFSSLCFLQMDLVITSASCFLSNSRCSTVICNFQKSHMHLLVASFFLICPEEAHVSLKRFYFYQIVSLFLDRSSVAKTFYILASHVSKSIDTFYFFIITTSTLFLWYFITWFKCCLELPVPNIH